MRALFNLPAPAKINWFLHVTGKRPDGYHTLQTVFQFIDWCDTLDLIQRDDGLRQQVSGRVAGSAVLVLRSLPQLGEGEVRAGVDGRDD